MQEYSSQEAPTLYFAKNSRNLAVLRTVNIVSISATNCPELVDGCSNRDKAAGQKKITYFILKKIL